MKRFLYLILLITLSCSKSVDISYGDEENTSSFLVGVWDGPMTCSVCCSDDYRYTLTISKHRGNTIEGELRLANIPDQQYYAKFKLLFNLDGSILTVKTNGKYEENGPKPGCGNYCTKNTYVLNINDAKNAMKGAWVSSDFCSTGSDITSINLKKQ
ncbi:conserved hypothetical protein [Tenacibaculum litopenaei]|uniref:hypothetical protein n=1 Tax=Tenacibaculum litopenaei TaxID=396016 RepID=UPI0038953C92